MSTDRRTSMSVLATAMAEAITGAPRRRVPLTTLLAAAASVDRSAAAAAVWRTRVAAAIDELAEANLVELPSTRWDKTSEPPLPEYVTRRAEHPARAADPRPAVVWHAELAWAAQLDAAGELGEADRRFLVHVNAWLPRRPAMVVPQRERSLDICGDEKALDAVVFTPIFAAGRLTHEMLRCEPCWPPVHQEVLGPGPWLIVENWTTFRSLCEAARRCGWRGRLVWGAGNQVGTRLTSLAATEPVPASGLLYFGDIDTAGFRIARMAAARAETLGLGTLRAAYGLYQMCLANGVPRSTPHRAAEDLRHWAYLWLGGTVGHRVAELVAVGGRVVQEVVGRAALEAGDVASLLDAHES
jgi:hypothetical protein